MPRAGERDGHGGEPLDGEEPEEPDEPEAIDLHGLRPDEALRRVARGLHACRVRRVERLLIVTGRGWGNRLQQPILRPKVEQWLAGPEGRRLGVVRYEVTRDGGAIVVDLRSDGRRRDGSDEDLEPLR